MGRALACHPYCCQPSHLCPERADDREGDGRESPPGRDPGATAEKTNGVPLFVEELTKMVLESGLVKEKAWHYELAGPRSTGHPHDTAGLADGQT